MFYEKLIAAPADPIFGLYQAYLSDSRKDKINLGIGIYSDETLHHPTLSCIDVAKDKALKRPLIADYLPIEGHPSFREEMAKMLLGKALYDPDTWLSIQTLGGTGALSLAAQFLADQGFIQIYLPQPTWVNHINLFEKVGIKCLSYPYFSSSQDGLDYSQMKDFLQEMETHALVLFHMTCHNPTGCDPNKKQWEELLSIVEKKSLYPIFDFAYHGFCEGEDTDLEVLRLFAKAQVPLMVCYSCSKNFGLYQQRVGLLLTFGKTKDWKEKIASLLKKNIRANYSNPPSFGPQLVCEILQDPMLKQQWSEDLQEMRNRLSKGRKYLVEALNQQLSQDFSYLLSHKGMFSLLPLQKEQAKKLIDTFGIYLPASGRINVCGITQKNAGYIAQALSQVLS